jgi:hypothetical protein
MPNTANVLMRYLQSGAALRDRWWQFGIGWGITGCHYGRIKEGWMDIQEWDIDHADAITLVFYDLISVQLADGREIPIWSKHSEHRLGEAEPDSMKLLFISKRPISIEQAKSLQSSIKARNEKGWYHEIV